MLASSVCALISSRARAAAAAGMLSSPLHCSAMKSSRSIFARPTNPLAYSCRAEGGRWTMDDGREWGRVLHDGDQ